MPPAGFEPTIPASERSQTHALDRAATGIVYWNINVCNLKIVNMALENGHLPLSATTVSICSLYVVILFLALGYSNRSVAQSTRQGCLNVKYAHAHAVVTSRHPNKIQTNRQGFCWPHTPIRAATIPAASSVCFWILLLLDRQTVTVLLLRSNVPCLWHCTKIK